MLRAAQVLVLALALGVAAGATGPSRALAREDRWLAPDKALHFGASAALAVGGYALGLALFDRVAPRLLLGGSIALGLGVAKELLDAAGAGDASWRDLTWDLLGTVAGLLVSWSLDLLLRSDPRAAPAAGGP